MRALISKNSQKMLHLRPSREDKHLKVIVVNQTCISINDGSLKMSSKFPLKNSSQSIQANLIKIFLSKRIESLPSNLEFLIPISFNCRRPKL